MSQGVPSGDRVVDWEWAPRVVVVVVVAALAIPTLPLDDLPIRSAVDILAASTFCAWLWLRTRISNNASLVLGAALTGIGIYMGPDPAQSLALVVGASVIVVLQPLRRLVWVIAGLLLVICLGWTAGGISVWSSASASADWLLITFVISMLERTYTAAYELRRTQQMLADEQVDQERLRLNRELAKMLGRTFTDASERIDRALSLVSPDDQVRSQLTDLADLVGQGPAQLGCLSAGPPVQHIDDEIVTAQKLCKQFGVDMTTSVDELSDPQVSEFAAVVVCESVTNMFKHAEPTRCVVVVREDDDEVILSVTNDGVSESSRGPGGRSGQRHWRTQLETLGGGELTSGPLSAGRYRVLVRIPRSVAA